MIHYHGTPITPREQLDKLAGRCFCVSFAAPGDVKRCHEIGQSVMLDNGAFSIWRKGKGNIDVDRYAEWVSPWLDYQSTWCIIPDVIGGDEYVNDELLLAWDDYGFPREQCAPVWHMHESLDRLQALCGAYPLVCIGSSGEYAKVYTPTWHKRLSDTFDAICDERGKTPCKLHMLRGLNVGGGPYPFYSADSTNIARNWNNPSRNRGEKLDVRAMANRIDARQTPGLWVPEPAAVPALTLVSSNPAPEKDTRQSLVTEDGFTVYYGNRAAA